jgi:hypothetical protein
LRCVQDDRGVLKDLVEGGLAAFDDFGSAIMLGLNLRLLTLELLFALLLPALALFLVLRSLPLELGFPFCGFFLGLGFLRRWHRRHRVGGAFGCCLWVMHRAMLVRAYRQFAAKLLAVNDDGRFGGFARYHWLCVRVDVHPYEEAQGFQRLLDIPGYDVAALVEKSGKSASHVYARLSLLQLIPTVAEAFTQERITASHANLIARLPQESQAEAFEQCWRKDWQDKEPHLLPAKHVAAWIQANLYLPLADAPFDREDPTLNPAAGACVTCPRRSGHNTALFADVVSDQCLDSSCYHSKVEGFLDREIAAQPGLVQIENGWRNPKEQRPGAVQRGHVREIPDVIDNPLAVLD